jgi:signal transduction histidine kinase
VRCAPVMTAAAELAALRSSLQRELDALRGYVNQLRPDVASGEAFDQAIAEAAAVLRRLGLAVDLRMTASGELLPEAARAAVVRICQEALRNVGRHASASRAWISTDLLPSDARRPARWRIEIGDDVERRGSRHFGLRFMRERAGQVHADLAIDSRPGQGTVVHLVVPLGQQQLEVS